MVSLTIEWRMVTLSSSENTHTHIYIYSIYLNFLGSDFALKKKLNYLLSYIIILQNNFLFKFIIRTFDQSNKKSQDYNNNMMKKY